MGPTRIPVRHYPMTYSDRLAAFEKRAMTEPVVTRQTGNRPS